DLGDRPHHHPPRTPQGWPGHAEAGPGRGRAATPRRPCQAAHRRRTPTLRCHGAERPEQSAAWRPGRPGMLVRAWAGSGDGRAHPSALCPAAVQAICGAFTGNLDGTGWYYLVVPGARHLAEFIQSPAVAAQRIEAAVRGTLGPARRSLRARLAVPPALVSSPIRDCWPDAPVREHAWH